MSRQWGTFERSTLVVVMFAITVVLAATVNEVWTNATQEVAAVFGATLTLAFVGLLYLGFNIGIQAAVSIMRSYDEGGAVALSALLNYPAAILLAYAGAQSVGGSTYAAHPGLANAILVYVSLLVFMLAMRGARDTISALPPDTMGRVKGVFN